MARALGFLLSKDSVRLIDALVDFPSSELLRGASWKGPGGRLLAEVLLDSRLRPEDPVMLHDWGLKGPNRPSLDALRRAAEALLGPTGVLLADLHVSLDAIESLELDPDGYAKWARAAGVDERVSKFLLSMWAEVERLVLSRRRRRD